MLDWQRTLFAAFIGGLVGFLASILMEWLKPFIASRVLRARMKEDIYDELSRFLVIAYRLAETPDKERTYIFMFWEWPIYRHYFSHNLSDLLRSILRGNSCTCIIFSKRGWLAIGLTHPNH